MKKYIIAIVAALATAFGASAVDYSYTLVLNRTDGTKTNFLFEYTPIATINGDDLTILENSTGLSVVVPISEITNFTFDKEVKPDGVKNVGISKDNVLFGLSKDALEVSGLEPNTEIALFDAEGKLRVRGSGNADGFASLDISGLDKGVYIVKAGKNTFKFIR